MAEILGIVASAIAVAQIAGQIAGIGYGYIGGVKRAPDDIKKFLDELNALSRVLTTLRDVVEANPDSIASNHLNALLQECMSEMMGLEAKLKPQDWWRKKAARYRWPLRSKETADFTSKVERYKSSFTLALATDQLNRTKTIEIGIQELKIRQSEVKRREMLHWLSPEAFDVKHVEISGRRQENTGEWLLKRPEVRDWTKKNPNSPVLWGHGIPGSGKTFLSSRIIDHLLEEAPKSLYGVAYVYFDYKERDQQKPVHVLASLVKQLVLQTDNVTKEIEMMYDKFERQQKRPRLNDVYSMLLVVIKSFSQTFIVCDALDECDQDDQRRELLPLFHRMGNDGINIFLTSRRHPEDIQDSLQGSANVELSAQAEDITSYVEQKIYDNPRARRLFKHGNLKAKLISELTGHTKGMFLLVRFHTEYICQQPTVREIMRELDRLKISLSEESPLDPIYNRAMDMLKDQHKNLVGRALKILYWLVKARRTLTVHELQQAVSVELGQTELDELDLLDRKTILDVCASLVSIDEKSDTVRLAHYTVQEYLLKHSIIPEDADFKIAMACTTFLSFDVFSQGACTSNSSLSDRYDRYPLLDYAARKLSFHLKSYSEDLPANLILKFLKSPGCIASYTQAFYIPKYSTSSDRWDEFPKSHLALHVAASLGLCSVIQQLLEGKIDIMARDDRGQNALHCAAFGGHEKMIQLLLQNGIDILAVDWRGWSALHWAAASGHESAVLLLLEEGADISAADSRRWTALHGAIAYAYESVIRVLLEKGADISAVDDRGSTALHWAAAEGSESVVRLVLEKGADIYAVDDRGLTALHIAACDNGGNEPVVRLLLERGVDVSSIDVGGLTALYKASTCGNESIVRLLLDSGADIAAGRWTALHGAATRGHKAVAQILLERGADISAVDEHGLSVLHSASSGLDEHEPIVRLLLEKGANISAVDGCGLTALHWAATNGHESVVQLLLQKGANISATDEFGWTAFHKAAENGHESMVILLLEKGANISDVSNSGMTALHGAAARGNESMLRLLLRLGAKVSVVDNRKRGALHWAAQAGDEQIVRLLLERGASISATSEGGATPLHWAAEHSHEPTVRLLLERGADASAVDDRGETALHCAARGGDELTVQVLLEKGADPSAKRNNGDTVLGFAESGGHELVVHLLKKKINERLIKEMV